MNPLFRREFLGRWRDRRSHLLLLALALLLALSAYRGYENALSFSPLNTRVFPPQPFQESSITRASRAGHQLFSTLAIGNVAVWFVLSPLLLATGVARERERGLLESLQLSPMKPASQIVARTLSALAYLAVLQLVTLPLYFVAFSFGGVSQEEIARVWAIVAASAFCGVGLGLALSAQSPRPSGALFGAVALLVGWSALSYVGGTLAPWWWIFGVAGASDLISRTLYYAHPLALVWQLSEPTTRNLPGWVVSSPEEALPWALIGWILLGGMGLAMATRDVTRSLPPLGWAGRNTLIQRWKTRREARLKAQSERRHAKVSVEGALLADLPFERLIRFKNPLLNREVKSRFRVRRASPWVWTGRFILFLGGAAVWVMVLFSVFFDPPGRPGAVPLVLWSEWLLGTALVGTFAASSFAREREAGTWEGVQLSLLSPGEVMRTKWLSPVVAFAFLTCPLWLMLLALVPLGNWSGVPLRWIMLGALVVVSSLCWISALGSWISVCAKTTAGATCWTIGVLLAWFMGMSLLEGTFEIHQQLTAWRFGMPKDSLRSIHYSWDTRESIALFQKETGSPVQLLVPSRAAVTPAQVQEWQRYYQWLEERKLAVLHFETAIGAWNTVNVLSAFQDRHQAMYLRGRYNGSFLLEDETLLGMALFNMVLTGAATLVLLLGVRARLQRSSE